MKSTGCIRDVLEENNKYSWVVRPASEFKGRAVLGAIIIVLSGVVITWAAENNFIFGAVAIILMVFASSKFFFKTYYYVDETGIGEKFLGYHRTRKWGEFKRVEEGNKAVFLSPFEKPRRLDNYRGWLVPVPNINIKEYILTLVREANLPDKTDANLKNV